MTQNICGALVPLETVVVPDVVLPGCPRNTFEDVLAPTEAEELPAAAPVVIIPVVLIRLALSNHVSSYNIMPLLQLVHLSELPLHVFQLLSHFNQSLSSL